MVPARIRALFLLAFALLRTFFVRLLFRRDGVAAFRANYDPDGLSPVTEEERLAMSRFSRCIACGVCDRGEADRIARSGGAYRGIMSLILAASRSMPDYRAAAYSFSFVPDDVLREKETTCPTRVPMREIARFVRTKADDVGGPWPLPPRIKSLPPEQPTSSRPQKAVPLP